MPEVSMAYKMDTGERSDETDPIAEEMIRHELIDRHPGVTDVRARWYTLAGDWFLLATGTIPEKEEGTT